MSKVVVVVGKKLFYYLNKFERVLGLPEAMYVFQVIAPPIALA